MWCAGASNGYLYVVKTAAKPLAISKPSPSIQSVPQSATASHSATATATERQNRIGYHTAAAALALTNNWIFIRYTEIYKLDVVCGVWRARIHFKWAWFNSFSSFRYGTFQVDKWTFRFDDRLNHSVLVCLIQIYSYIYIYMWARYMAGLIARVTEQISPENLMW